MANILRRQLNTINFTAGQLVSMPDGLQKPHVYTRLNCRLTGTLVIAGGTTSGAAVAENPASIIKQIQLKLGGKVTPILAPASSLYQYSSIFSGSAGELTAVANGDAATTNFIQDFHLFLETPKCLQPWHTWLNSKNWDMLEFGVLWGSVEDLVAGGDRTKTLSNIKLEVLSLEITDPITGVFSIGAIGERAFSLDSTVSGKSFDLPKGNLLRGVIIKTTDVLAPANTILTGTIAVVTNGINYHRKINAVQLRAENKLQFGMETFPTGYYVLDFLEDGNIENMIDLRNVSEAKLLMDVTKLGGVTMVYVYPLEIIPPVKS